MYTSFAFLFIPAPTVRDLAISLKDLVKWEEFAQHLPHISQADITRIKIENNFDVEAQKRALFDKWLRVDTEANWEKVVEVLDLNGESKLSKNIRTKYNITDQVTSVEPAVVTITSEGMSCICICMCVLVIWCSSL